MTTAFWKTIEEIPGLTTDCRDWRLRLQGCWPQAKPYLAKTPRLVDQIDCPSPGGEHCPRRVVRHPDGKIRAVCGDPERLCRTLELNIDDIRIHEINRRKLFGDIAAALGVTTPPGRRPGAAIIYLGDHEVCAGRGFPVFAALASRQAPLSVTDVFALSRRELPFVLLVPSLEGVDGVAAAAIEGAGGRILMFDECVRFASTSGFEPTMPPASLFAREIASLDAAETAETAPLVMELPVGVRWGDLKFTFVADDVLNVSYLRRPPKRIEPEGLGMKDKRSSKATRQWRLLLACAALGGALPRSFPVSTIKGRRPATDIMRILTQFQRGYERQRQLLAAALRERFGIDEDPFSAEGDCYAARFVIDASGLRQGRADQRGRNFADDD